MSLYAFKEGGRRFFARRLPSSYFGFLAAAGLLLYAAPPARAVVSLRLNSAGVITNSTALTVTGHLYCFK
jgi:hypothetical protein